MKRYILEIGRCVDDIELCEDPRGGLVYYSDHAAELAARDAQIARMSAVFREGVLYTDKLTGRSERVCPGCAAILDDRGWLCSPGCPVVAMREEG